MSMTENPRHHLEFDGLDLTGRTTYGEGAQWWRYEALGEGASPGNSEPLTSEQASALFDGALVTLDRWGNRVQSWPVRIVAANSAGLALGERMLTSRTGDRRVTMAYEPPDGWGARTLWSVMISSTAHQFDDMNELRCQRVYTLNLTCAPFGYGAEEVTTSGLTASDGTASITLPGSAPSPGSMTVSEISGSGAMGAALLYSSPELGVGVDGVSDSEYLPRVSSGSSSGTINAKRLPPGTYLLVARFSHSSSIADARVAVEVEQSNATDADVTVTSSAVTSADTFSTGFVAIVPVGLVELPLRGVPRETTTATVTLTGSVVAGGGTVSHLWAFHMGDESAVTLVNKITSGQYLELIDPVLESATPAIYVGSSAGTMQHPGIDRVLSWGEHRFTPPLAKLYAAVGAGTHTNIPIDLTHRPAFHHFAAHIED